MSSWCEDQWDPCSLFWISTALHLWHVTLLTLCFSYWNTCFILSNYLYSGWRRFLLYFTSVFLPPPIPPPKNLAQSLRKKSFEWLPNYNFLPSFLFPFFLSSPSSFPPFFLPLFLREQENCVLVTLFSAGVRHQRGETFGTENTSHGTCLCMVQ